MNKIFSDYGCEILEKEGKFYIKYDSGESAGSSECCVRISEEDAYRAMRSEKDAYFVILEAQRR